MAVPAPVPEEERGVPGAEFEADRAVWGAMEEAAEGAQGVAGAAGRAAESAAYVATEAGSDLAAGAKAVAGEAEQVLSDAVATIGARFPRRSPCRFVLTCGPRCCGRGHGRWRGGWQGQAPSLG